jgi:hypothetical protein
MISFRYGVLTIHLLGGQPLAGLTAAWRLTALRAYKGSFLSFLSFFHAFFWGGLRAPSGYLSKPSWTLLKPSWGLSKENSLFLFFSFFDFPSVYYFLWGPLWPSWTPPGALPGPYRPSRSLLGAPSGVLPGSPWGGPGPPWAPYKFYRSYPLSPALARGLLGIWGP